MTACELCGHDPADAIAEAITEDGEAQREHAAEQAAEDRQTAVALAEVHEAAETERAAIAADAAVAITEADAAADVAVAEALAEALDDDEHDDEHEGQADEHDDEGTEDVAEDEADEVTPVAVPPQPDEDEPAHRSDANAARPAARRRRHRFGRR